MKWRIARSIVSLFLAVITGCIIIQANAQMLTFEFSGTLSNVVLDSQGTVIWGLAGDPFWGTLSYDPTWQNLNNDDGSGYYTYIAYHGYPAEQAITMSISTPSQSRQIGPNSGVQNEVSLRISDAPGNYLFQCGGEYGGAGAGVMLFILADPTGSGLNGTSVPSNLDLNDWATHYIEIFDGLGGGDVIQGDITSLQLVPEPGVETMLGLGVFTWLLKRLTRTEAAS